MKALLITNTFPPLSGSHVQRMLKMSNALVDKGIDLYVLTQDIDINHPQYDESFINEVNPKIHIIRVQMGFLHRTAYSHFKAESNAHYNKNSKSNSFFKNLIYDLVTKIKRDVLFPDTMVDWYYEVKKFEKKNRIVKNLNPDVIISCSQPNSVHMIGYELSKMYKIPLYMDYADPWVYLGDYKKVEKTVRFRRGRAKESSILKRAIGYSFSAPGCRDLYIEKYDIPSCKTIVAMSGYEERLLDRARNNQFDYVNSNVITMTYGGALHEYVRDPKPFFLAIKHFEDSFDVNIRTDNLDLASGLLNSSGGAKCVHILPYLSFDKYFDEMTKTDIILFFGNKNDVQLPGKIFNCIATGKYILYIKSNKVINDTVERILTSYGRSYVVQNDEKSIIETLKILIYEIKKIRTKVNLSCENILRFSDKKQYAALSDHLYSMLETK